MINNLSATPPGALLYICELPRFYAAGDDDIVLLHRSVAEDEDLAEYQREVMAFIQRRGGDWTTEHRVSQGPGSLGLMLFAAFLSPRLTMTAEQVRDRIAELQEPLRLASKRADKVWAKTVLNQ